MKTSSKKNPAPLAPTSTAPGKPVEHSAAMPERGKLMKKKNTAAGDPTKMAKPSRTFVKATGGARYGVRVKFQKSESPEAGATQANGRILPAAMKAQAPSFSAGMSDHN
jgi:hypothetical protein